MNLSKRTKVTRVKAAQGAGTSTVVSDSVDMAGFEGVVFVGAIGTANAGNFGKAAQSADDTNFDDLAATKVVPGDDDDSFLIDVMRPLDRYVRCEVVRGVSTAVGEIYAIQYGAAVMPTSHGPTIDAETHISPAEGTA